MLDDQRPPVRVPNLNPTIRMLTGTPEHVARVIAAESVAAAMVAAYHPQPSPVSEFWARLGGAR